MFDTINHLSSLKEWGEVFKNASHHLKNGGIFLFDFNTLDCFRKKTGFEKIIDGKKVIFEIKTKNNVCEWIIKIGNKCLKVKEISFDERDVVKEVEKYFKKTKIFYKSDGACRCYIYAKK